MTNEKGFASLLLPNSRMLSQHPDYILSSFLSPQMVAPLFHVKLSGHHVMCNDSLFLPISSMVSASRSGPKTSICRERCQTSRVSFLRARLFWIKLIAGTLRSYCSPCSAKAATFRYFKPVKSNFGPRGRTSASKRYQTWKNSPCKPSCVFLSPLQPLGLRLKPGTVRGFLLYT